MQRRKRKFWNKLKGKLSLKEIREKQVERLICAIQQELEWDDKDIATHLKMRRACAFDVPAMLCRSEPKSKL